MKKRIFVAAFVVASAIPLVLFGQTKLSASRHSYLMPKDSLSYELSLERGDIFRWDLWLGPALEKAGQTVLTFGSDVEGQLWERRFDSKSVEVDDKVAIFRPARYRLTVKSDGDRGRLAKLGVWTELSRGNRTPFPVPSVQRMAENFSAGDKFVIEYEFLLPKTIEFSKLLELDLPQDLVHLWAITPLGDSLPAAVSVRRWFGESGVLSLRERAPRGGRLTLRLELDVTDDGEATVFLAPGVSPPDWLPDKARMVRTLAHDPWGAIVVPPIAVLAETLAARPAELPSAPYAAQSLRARGVDSITAAYLTHIYIKRDSLDAMRRSRLDAATGYDTQFLTGERAFLPPDLHVVLSFPLVKKVAESQVASLTRLVWFVESMKGKVSDARLHQWHYDEACIALAEVPDEFFWDKQVLPLHVKHEVQGVARAGSPATITVSSHRELRPPTFRRDGKKYVDDSREVLGLYLENDSDDTLYLVYHQAQRIERPFLWAFLRWPLAARIGIIGFGIFGIVGLAALIAMRQREQKRRRRAEELDAELEKAREVQLKLLPGGPMEVTGLKVFGLHQSMQSVGGDYYDFFALEDGRVMLCIADVAGHGLSAALLMSNLQATLRVVAQAGRKLTEIVALLNHEICQRTSPDRFVTLVLAEISADRSRVALCNAGHNPAYIVRASGQIEEVESGGIMLGVMDMSVFIEVEHRLEAGDTVVLYTDGIPEATYGINEMFGYQRMKYFLQDHRADGLASIAQGLFRRVTPDEAHTIEDDMAIILARVMP